MRQRYGKLWKRIEQALPSDLTGVTGMGVRLVGGEGNENCRGWLWLLHVYPVPVLVSECVDAVGEIEEALPLISKEKEAAHDGED